MTFKELIEGRRAYRSFVPVEITEDILKELMEAASLAMTCFNMQPARLVFVFEPEPLKKVQAALSKGNVWATQASMIIAACSRKDLGCVMEETRNYNLYDTGTQVAFLILRATELGLVAHPIAGYAEKAVKDALGIPDDYEVISLIIVGKHTDAISPLLSPKQVELEKNRPERFPYDKVFYRNKFTPPPEKK